MQLVSRTSIQRFLQRIAKNTLDPSIKYLENTNYCRTIFYFQGLRKFLPDRCTEIREVDKVDSTSIEDIENLEDRMAQANSVTSAGIAVGRHRAGVNVQVFTRSSRSGSGSSRSSLQQREVPVLIQHFNSSRVNTYFYSYLSFLRFFFS